MQLGVSAPPFLHLKKQPILSKQSFSATIKLRSSLTEPANPYGWANPSLLEIDVPQVYVVKSYFYVMPSAPVTFHTM